MECDFRFRWRRYQLLVWNIFIVYHIDSTARLYYYCWYLLKGSHKKRLLEDLIIQRFLICICRSSQIFVKFQSFLKMTPSPVTMVTAVSLFIRSKFSKFQRDTLVAAKQGNFWVNMQFKILIRNILFKRYLYTSATTNSFSKNIRAYNGYYLKSELTTYDLIAKRHITLPKRNSSIPHRALESRKSPDLRKKNECLWELHLQ